MLHPKAAGISILLAGLVLAGCGADGGVANREGDSSNPGDGGDGGENPDLLVTDCAPTERLCPRSFVWSGSPTVAVTGDEKQVLVAGDFKPGGWQSGLAMTYDAASKSYRATVPVPWNIQVQYKFHITFKDGTDKWVADPGNPATADDGFGGTNSVLMPATCAQFTCPPSVVMPAAGSFDWRDAVLYFVFVDRFVNGDLTNDKPIGVERAADWQGGDWAGVTRKINDGYFSALGVNTLWITVPMDNTDNQGQGTDNHQYSAYHGYWPRDLGKTEARFGSALELGALVAAAHKAKLRVLLDYAMNHVHEDSPTYLQHKNDGWFNPLNVNGQSCLCGSPACGWDGPMARVCWFTPYLPDFNFANADARRYSVDNAMYWIKSSGADGFRLDAVKHIELQWLIDLRARLTAEVEPVTKEHVYLVGETFTGDANLIKSFVDPARLLDGQFDFPLRLALNKAVLLRQGSMKDLVGYMDGQVGFYGSGSVMSTFVGNQDVPRAIHFAEDAPAWTDLWADGRDRNWNNQPGTVAAKSAYERLSVAFALLFTNRGIPLIYYGDEIGMAGAGDPDNRRMMYWNNYNPGQTLLLDRIEKLGAIRADRSALRRGDRTTLYSDDDVWVYQMVDANDIVYVALNRGDSSRVVGGLPAGKNLEDVIAGELVSGPNVMIPARGVRVMVFPKLR